MFWLCPDGTIELANIGRKFELYISMGEVDGENPA
jgi:hypothetical protein